MFHKLSFQLALALTGAVAISWTLWHPLLGETPFGPNAEPQPDHRAPHRAELIHRTYDIRDLMRQPAQVFPVAEMAEIDANPDLDEAQRAHCRALIVSAAREEEILPKIQRAIDPPSWKQDAHIAVVETGWMSVTQTEENHQHIKQWLAHHRWSPGAEEFMRRCRWLSGLALFGVFGLHYSLRRLPAPPRGKR